MPPSRTDLGANLTCGARRQLDAVLRNYDKLSEEPRADLPLKRVWLLVEE